MDIDFQLISWTVNSHFKLEKTHIYQPTTAIFYNKIAHLQGLKSPIYTMSKSKHRLISPSNVHININMKLTNIHQTQHALVTSSLSIFHLPPNVKLNQQNENL